MDDWLIQRLDFIEPDRQYLQRLPSSINDFDQISWRLNIVDEDYDRLSSMHPNNVVFTKLWIGREHGSE